MAHPGTHRGEVFQSWEARVARQRTKAAVGEVGVWGEEERAAAQATSRARGGTEERRCAAAQRSTEWAAPDANGRARGADTAGPCEERGRTPRSVPSARIFLWPS